MINLKDKVVLPVWFNTEQSAAKKDLGLEENLTIEDYETKEVFFYSIDALEPCVDEILGDCTIVNVAGKEFSCSIPFDKIEEVIQDQLDGFK